MGKLTIFPLYSLVALWLCGKKSNTTKTQGHKEKSKKSKKSKGSKAYKLSC